MIYLELLWSFFQIGLLSIGGGYSALPLIQFQAVELHGWLTFSEYADLISVSEITPGPIAINSATFVGTRVAGIWGGVVATIGFVTPSVIIVLTLWQLFKKFKNINAVQGILVGLKAVVTALIMSAGLSVLILALWNNGAFKDIDLVQTVIFIASFLVIKKFKKINPILVMAGAGIVSVTVYLITNSLNII